MITDPTASSKAGLAGTFLVDYREVLELQEVLDMACLVEDGEQVFYGHLGALLYPRVKG